ncbi:MAG TPA: AMP-binding protein [Longimicrobiaceae bacterium]|nr:AMP-binding protein [Longimicrobiaceae bacterium]
MTESATLSEPVRSDFDPAASTFVELLAWRAAASPDAIAYRFLRDGEGESVDITYAGLDRQARHVAARLLELKAADERVLLLYPPGLDYVAAFFGCLYAGAKAVPAYPPRANRSVERLDAIIADARPRVALTTPALLESCRSRIGHAAGDPVIWLATGHEEGPAPTVPAGLRASRESTALLQYTSGSTSTPKGVEVTHANLMHNVARTAECFGFSARSRFLSWLPPYHDMGLVGGLLQPLYNGAPGVLMPPVAFLQRPLRWLEAMSRERTTATGGPDFAYRLCVQRVTEEQRERLDLSALELAGCGSEPVRPETVRQFTAYFAPAGFRPEAFRPSYGMAEATLMVSGGSDWVAPLITSLDAGAFRAHRVEDSAPPPAPEQLAVGCGPVLPGTRVLVVDPQSRRVCGPREIGEIWLSGPNVARGYWNRPEETAETFGARLADTGEGPFLRTGDLGFMRGGELFIAGRRKELIIARGRNYYPQDLERTVQSCHPALAGGRCAAFGVDGEAQEGVVIVQELGRHGRRELDALAEEVRRAVTREHDLEPSAVVFVEPLSVPVTSSGKIQRGVCRDDWLQGRLRIVHLWSRGTAERRSPPAISAWEERVRRRPSSERIAGWLQARLAHQVGMEAAAIDIRLPFSHYGLDSVTAVSVAAELEALLDLKLPATLVWDHPTIDELARHLASAARTPRGST